MFARLVRNCKNISSRVSQDMPLSSVLFKYIQQIQYILHKVSFISCRNAYQSFDYLKMYDSGKSALLNDLLL